MMIYFLLFKYYSFRVKRIRTPILLSSTISSTAYLDRALTDQLINLAHSPAPKKGNEIRELS